MLSVAGMAGFVRVRMLVSTQLEDGRRVHTGELVEVSEPEAQRLVQSAQATFEPAPARAPSSCSARRDELWKAGIR